MAKVLTQVLDQKKKDRPWVIWEGVRWIDSNFEKSVAHGTTRIELGNGNGLEKRNPMKGR